ncbi:hypothetical protein [Metapseudomonas otitidis]|uniref:hypothetical protein n=1 Tax=Metapseudomonas otitidis TaxID=319939 RepID=UPI003C7D7168
MSWIDALEVRNGKAIQALVPDQYNGHTIAANRVIGSTGVLIFLDIVFYEANAVTPEVLAGLLAVAAPGSGIHDDLAC